MTGRKVISVHADTV